MRERKITVPGATVQRHVVDVWISDWLFSYSQNSDLDTVAVVCIELGLQCARSTRSGRRRNGVRWVKMVATVEKRRRPSDVFLKELFTNMYDTIPKYTA